MHIHIMKERTTLPLLNITYKIIENKETKKYLLAKKKNCH